MKPTDKAILGMVSKSPGRNKSEPIGGLEKAKTPEVEPASQGRRQHGLAQTDCGARSLRRGVSDSTVTRAC